MANKQETVYVVLRKMKLTKIVTANKVFDDRADARNYASRLNKHSVLYRYSVHGVKKG